MKLTVVSRDQGVVRVRSDGDITLLDFHAAPDPLEQLLGQGCHAEKILLCLEGSPFVDSAGVGWLILCEKKAREAKGVLVVHSLPPMVQHVFRLLGVPTLLRVAATEAEALRLVEALPATQPAV